MTRAAVQNRLRHYWKMEAANVFFAPAIGTAVVIHDGDHVGLPMIFAMLATASLLVIGAFALRAHYKMTKGEPDTMKAFVPVAARLQKPMLLLCVAAMVGAGYALWRDKGFSPSGIATCVFALLATLEYINYYVVQLQHFDHAADFRRLIAGQGFRRSHLARAIARYRIGGQDTPTAPLSPQTSP